MEDCLQLVFIPWPVMGHVQIVQFAKLIIHRQNLISAGTKLSVTVLLMKLPEYVDAVSGSFMDKLCASSSTNDSGPSVNFFQLPSTEPEPEWSSKTRGYFIHNLVVSQKPNVADFLSKSKVVAVVVDMLCTPMIHVANEFNLPSYVFFTSPASFLGAMLHFQVLHDEKNQNVSELKNMESEIFIPSLANPFPVEALPLVLVEKQMWLDRFLHYARDYRKAKGIIVNTFVELDSYALNSFVQDSTYGVERVPPIYPVGPILNQEKSLGTHTQSSLEIMLWLDKQPPNSVVFVCFGSQGSLHEDQVKELAHGLERSRQRFLWALRRQSPNDKRANFPSEYASFREVLPDGFLDRTALIGKVVGWVPQLEVLSHPSTGGFISHCGWNSVLESVWCGVPIATWPLHAEQQMNAFQLVREIGVGVEITLSYYERSEDGALIKAIEIEKGIKDLMQNESEVRKKVKEMKEKSRISVIEGGSSYASLIEFINHLLSPLQKNKSLSFTHT